MMKKVYLCDKKALAFFQQAATSHFWDAHWETDREHLRQRIMSYKSDKSCIPLVKKYLPQSSTILEGGCGLGYLVHALNYQGYNAIGIDFAENTVQLLHEVVPELDIRIGDVRNLPIGNGELDGYISGGVIEHFWEGYHPILAEMQRTLKNGGFLFISFPYMSFVRKLKARLRNYPISDSCTLEPYKETFYQFALHWETVVSDLQQLGFILQKALPIDGIKGFKDELTWFRPWLQPIYDGKVNRKGRIWLDILFRPFAAHGIMLVMQKGVANENYTMH